jgi:hypothetical protein
MEVSDLLGRLALSGVKLSIEGESIVAEPRSAITEELRELIRGNKTAILRTLAPIEQGRLMREQRALAELEHHPTLQRWAIFDADETPDFVICTVAIRNVGTCEFKIRAQKYDPWLVLDALRSTETH